MNGETMKCYEFRFFRHSDHLRTFPGVEAIPYGFQPAVDDNLRSIRIGDFVCCWGVTTGS